MASGINILRRSCVSQVFTPSISLIWSTIQRLICSLVLAKLIYHNDFAKKENEIYHVSSGFSRVDTLLSL